MPILPLSFAVPVGSPLLSYNTTANSGLFDVSDGGNPQFTLYLTPEQYTPVKSYEGDTGIQRGAAGVVVLNPPAIASIEINSIESRNAAYLVLDGLRQNSVGNGVTVTPIAVRDYHHLDNAAAVSAGYTLRQMVFDGVVERSGGAFSANGGVWVPGGLKFRLIQA